MFSYEVFEFLFVVVLLLLSSSSTSSTEIDSISSGSYATITLTSGRNVSMLKKKEMVISLGSFSIISCVLENWERLFSSVTIAELA